jgi:hypothetical protein
VGADPAAGLRRIANRRLSRVVVDVDVPGAVADASDAQDHPMLPMFRKRLADRPVVWPGPDSMQPLALGPRMFPIRFFPKSRLVTWLPSAPSSRRTSTGRMNQIAFSR